MKYVQEFDKIDLSNIATVGGKNASLGEMIQKLTPKGVSVPNGYVVNAQAYWDFVDDNSLRQPLTQKLKKLDTEQFSNLRAIGKACRKMILAGEIPIAIQTEIITQFELLKDEYQERIEVAVRSSATAEDLPQASFAGQQESYLNIQTDRELIAACHKCYASLFTDRAIKYRVDNGFEHMDVALSIGVQKMVRSDKACAGVCFTIDPETGFEDSIIISSSWGLGENVVKGSVTPDEFLVFKPTLKQGKSALISRKLGSKEKTMIYAVNKANTAGAIETTTVNLSTKTALQKQFTLNENEVIQLSKWAMEIEAYYGRPMDIEWAKDGYSNELFIVQARPETVHSQSKNKYIFHNYQLKEKGEILAEGKNVGSKIVAGKARLLSSPEEIELLEEGEVLVTSITNPDWDPVLKKAAAIITDRGGRTSHAAIVAREIGAVAVVGTGDATQRIKDGQVVTVSCAHGNIGTVYNGKLRWETSEIDMRKIKLPDTKAMFILADPGQAFKLSTLPNHGVGLMRLEFVINNTIQIHPMALIHFNELIDKKAKRKIEILTAGYDDKKEYFIEHLSQAVATIAAAFYPKEVIARMSDFKTNEYAHLIGGDEFEPHEENPMLGWRGASRYYHPGYRAGFELECKAMKRVRDEMGLTNLKLMLPFCRTPEEGKKVLNLMADNGLKRGKNNLEVYVMTEIPSNVILAEQFADIFDGFSIGSNDLTQLILGIDRDSEILSDLFDAQNKAVKKMIADVIKVAREKNVQIGFCGQAPSDFPEFAQFLVEHGINSVSFSPDALLEGIENINMAEEAIDSELVLH